VILRIPGGVRREVRILATLATPMVLTQLGMLTMGLVDTYMVGKLGPEALAAVALGHVWTFGTLVPFMGIMMGIDPLVSQAHGARQGERAGRALQWASVLALVLTPPLAAVWASAGPALRLLGQDPGLVEGAAGYARASIPGIAPFLLFTAVRHYLQGRERMTAPLVVIGIANLLNALLNWTLIFGNLGLPALGIRGAGLATALARLFMLAMLVGILVAFRMHRGAWVPWSRASFHPRGLRTVLRYGIPVGAQFAMEVWAFNAAALLAGLLGNLELAAHIIVIRVASFSFMMPVGIAIAAATRVGNLIGANDRPRAQLAAWVAIVLGAAVMLLWAALFLALRHEIPALFTDDAAVIALGAVAFPVAAAFQLFDGTQAVAAGVLRGMGTTRPAAVFGLVGFWILGLPLAWAFAFPLELGLAGIWWGLAAGLGAVAVMLVAWIRKRGPAHLTGSTLDHHPPS